MKRRGPALPRRLRAWSASAWLAASLGCAAANDPTSSGPERGPILARVGEVPIFRADVDRARARQRLTDASWVVAEGGTPASVAPSLGDAHDLAGPGDAPGLTDSSGRDDGGGQDDAGARSGEGGQAAPPANADAEERLLRQGALQGLVEQALLLGAARRAHVVALGDEVDSAWAQLTANWREDALSVALRAIDVTVPEVKAQLRQALVASKVLRAEALDRVCVRDADIDAYVAAHPEELSAPEQLRLRQVVVKDEGQVKEVQEAVRRRLPFAEVAARLSQAPEAAAGGALGAFARRDLPQQMAEVCFALRPQQLSRPVQASDGWHLFWVDDKLPAHARSLNQVRPRIERRLRAEAEARAAAAYIDRLHEVTHVQIFADNGPEH